MKLFFFSTALPDELFQQIAEKCNSFKPTFSGVGFDRNVAMGLAESADVEAVSYYPIPSYPKYRTLTQKSAVFRLGKLRGLVPGMWDLPVIKEWCYCAAAVRQVRRCGAEGGTIVVSGLYRCLLRPARRLKKKYGMKIYAIVPDIPELMSTYRGDYSWLRKLLNRLDVKHSARYRDCVDGFVLLSRHMNQVVNLSGKPWIVVDGMCDFSKMPGLGSAKEPSGERYCLYAGKITRKFGVDRLIEGFLRADLPEMKLYLCGDGDLTEDVRRIARENGRIVYLGLQPHDRVLELEQGAQLLIEPRPTDDILVKMSFPSKIIEYMASGTPVLTTNLPCFDEVYRNYQYRIDEQTPEGICRALRACMALPQQEREAMGRRARDFVAAYKTVEVQCRRIADFIGGAPCGSEETST